MAARAAIALSLAALAWAGSARAEDDPACAQYREPMAYNLCLARHGPKANNVGKLRGGPQPGRAAQDRFRNGGVYGRAPATRSYGTQGARRVRGRMHMEFQVR
jgi:hypothetical protein